MLEFRVVGNLDGRGLPVPIVRLSSVTPSVVLVSTRYPAASVSVTR